MQRVELWGPLIEPLLDPRDHRLAVLELTRRGHELYSECAPAAAAVGHQLEQALEMADREVLLRCLAKLAQTAQLLIAQTPRADESGALQT